MTRPPERLTEQARAALDAATVTDGDGRARVTVATQVDAGGWRQVKTALERISGGGRYVRGGVFRFPEGRDPRPELTQTVTSGLMPPDPRRRDGWFATPADLAQEIVHNDPHILGLWEDGPAGRAARVLEPSAGEGALADALAELGFSPVCVERDPYRAAVLRGKGYETVEGPFEGFWKQQQDAGGWFDLVVMNPPFRSHGTDGAYLAHLELAWTLLAPGGRLVAILPASVTFRDDNGHRQIANLIGRFGDVRELPADAFKASGTGTKTVLVTLDRPTNANPGMVWPVAADWHEGRPAEKWAGDLVMALCPYGHLLESVNVADWPGSTLETRFADPQWRVRCHQAVDTADRRCQGAMAG